MSQQPKMPAIRLEAELVPSTCWCSNLRSELPKADWDRLRRQCYRRADHRCEICGGVGTRHPVDCHEVWHYDDLRHVQRLDRVIALCPACHQVKHLGRTQAIGRENPAYRDLYDQALAHLARVNGWSPQQVKAHIADVAELWRERSRHEWTLDLTALSDYGIDLPPGGTSPRGRPSGTASIPPGWDEQAREWYWNCEGCGRRGAATLRRMRVRSRGHIKEIRLPAGWTINQGRLLCGSCSA